MNLFDIEVLAAATTRDAIHRKHLDDRPTWLKEMASGGDLTACYYPFFYQLCKTKGPLKVLEIGTYRGTSIAHFAEGSRAGGYDAVAVTIDIEADAKRIVDAELVEGHKLNIVPITTSSTFGVPLAEEYAPFDVLFIDGLHNFNQAYGEYYLYRPLVRDGGMIFFDDLSLDMATKEMQVLWEFIPDEKARLDMLHYTGFGVALKTPGVEVPEWFHIIKRATKRMQELQR
jgi:predicted O-methyltransferase YrrM